MSLWPYVEGADWGGVRVLRDQFLPHGAMVMVDGALHIATDVNFARVVYKWNQRLRRRRVRRKTFWQKAVRPAARQERGKENG